jgi:hypothetical protein
MKSSLRKLRGLAALHKHGHGGDHKDRRDLLSLAQLDELAKAYRVLLSLSLSRSLSLSLPLVWSPRNPRKLINYRVAFEPVKPLLIVLFPFFFSLISLQPDTT